MYILKISVKFLIFFTPNLIYWKKKNQLILCPLPVFKIIPVSGFWIQIVKNIIFGHLRPTACDPCLPICTKPKSWLSQTIHKLPIFQSFLKPSIQYVIDYWTMQLYPTKKREGDWTLREMGSTQEGGMGEGPALQAGSKVSSSSGAEEGATLPWSNQED